MASLRTTPLFRSCLNQVRSHYNRVNPFEKLMDVPLTSAKVTLSPEQEFIRKIGSKTSETLGVVPVVRNKYGQTEPFKHQEKQPLTAHKYVFMEDRKVDQFISGVNNLLVSQSRPAVPLMLPQSEVIGTDPAAANRRFKFVFTDIGKGSDETRTIIIRETDGVLRTAAPEERDQINHKYFPKAQKFARPIEAFEDKFLKLILADVRHHEVLDFVTTHRQSHQSDYIRVWQHLISVISNDNQLCQVHRRVFEDVDAKQIYSVLQGTSHWLNFVLFLINEGQINGLLFSLLSSGRLEDSISLVEFFNARHAQATGAKQMQGLEALKEYTQRGPSHKRQAEFLAKLLKARATAETAQA